MDALEKTVKKSISTYRNKKRNSPQNAYDQVDYYYDDEYYDEEYDDANTAILQRPNKWDQQWSNNYNYA